MTLTSVPRERLRTSRIAGVDVAYCLVTSGDAGGDDSTDTREERMAVREAEQTAAAKEVGRDQPDVPALARRPRRDHHGSAPRDRARDPLTIRPQLVITQNPERNYERIFSSHPDHMATGEATLRAVYPDARNPHAFPEFMREGFEPHTVSQVWIGGAHPTMVVDITKTFDQKFDALSKHVCQIGEPQRSQEDAARHGPRRPRRVRV